MTISDRDRRHRWAETCEDLARIYTIRPEERADLREIAAYLRAPESASSEKEEG